MANLPAWKDKALFTPGPLTTSQTVKQAMLRDMGSRDVEFIEIIQDVRRRLVALCASPDEYTAVLMPGSGTFGIESTHFFYNSAGWQTARSHQRCVWQPHSQNCRGPAHS